MVSAADALIRECMTLTQKLVFAVMDLNLFMDPAFQLAIKMKFESKDIAHVLLNTS